MDESEAGRREREVLTLYWCVGKVVGERFVVGIFGKERERERSLVKCKGFVRFHVIQCRWRIWELS